MRSKRFLLLSYNIGLPILFILLIYFGTPLIYWATGEDLDDALTIIYSQQINGRCSHGQVDWKRGTLSIDNSVWEDFFSSEDWKKTVHPLSDPPGQHWIFELSELSEYADLHIYPQSGLALLYIDTLHYQWFHLPETLEYLDGSYLTFHYLFE